MTNLDENAFYYVKNKNFKNKNKFIQILLIKKYSICYSLNIINLERLIIE